VGGGERVQEDGLEWKEGLERGEILSGKEWVDMCKGDT